MDKSGLDEIGKWSELKLEILRKYASAYSTILEKNDHISKHIYIDAFAGAGEHLSKSSGDLVPGSPRIALDLNPPFSEYHFIDLSEERAKGLAEIADKQSNVNVYHGDCNSVLLEKVFPNCRREDYHRALCLLDPYGLEVDWRVLQTAGSMESIEIFYNFMIMDANRNVLWKNPDRVKQSQINRMNAIWGDESWRNAAYVKRRTLFGEIEEKTNSKRVIDAFRKRLVDIAGFKYVPEPIPMKNTSGAIVYYLFFASPNRTGAKIVKEIFDKYRE